MPEEAKTLDLVELTRRAFEAANRRDLDAVISFFASDAVFEGRVGGDRGRAAIRSMLVEWFGAYEELEFRLEDVRNLDNGVVLAVVVQEGVLAGSASHGRFRQREGWVILWEPGLIARITTFDDIDVARAVAERMAEERRWAVSEEPTTSEPVRLARQGYEAASRGDLDAVMSLYAADAAYDLSDLGLETFEGAEAIRGFNEDWFRSWEEYRFEVQELLDLGHGVVLSVIREGGRLVGGSGRVEHEVAHLAIFANGKIEWQKAYFDVDAARAAAERLAEERG